MDSAKKQKLFHEPTPEEGLFRPFVIPGGQAGPESTFPPLPAGNDEVFGLPRDFWHWLEGDRELQAAFERMIETRVAKRVEEQFEKLRAAEAVRGFEIGRQQALAESIIETQKRADNLEQIARALLESKQSILRDHEKSWIRALSTVLKQFLVPNRELAIDGIQTWLSDLVESFQENGRIIVRMNPQDYGRVVDQWTPHLESRISLHKDPQLLPGEIQCECEGGGVFFSSDAQMKRLEEWIERANRS